MNDLPDDVEAILHRPPTAPSPQLRQRLFDETSAHLPAPPNPRPRRVRAALVAASVLLAAGAVWWMNRPAAVPPPPLTATALDDAKPPVSAVDLEWQAFDSSSQDRAAVYWSAGQEYIAAHSDYESALRCYRQALETGPAESRQITDEDDVLAMALKLDRLYQEKAP